MTYYENRSGDVWTWTVDDAIRGDGDDPYWFLVLESDRDPGVRCLVPEMALRRRLRDDEDDVWSTFDPRHRGIGIVDVEPTTPYDPVPRQASPTDVSLLDWSLTRDLNAVNGFLDHPALVAHDLGATNFPVAMFVARSPVDDSIVGAVVLKKPSARALDDWTNGGPHQGGDGSRVEVARLATRADRPMNTASWMLARAATWADQQGFDVVQAYAGMADNRGTCYDAAGFDLAVVDDDARGGDWNSADDRDGRVTVQDGDGWTRRRWERSLG